jgi:hypothetical protein
MCYIVWFEFSGHRLPWWNSLVRDCLRMANGMRYGRVCVLPSVFDMGPRIFDSPTPLPRFGRHDGDNDNNDDDAAAVVQISPVSKYRREYAMTTFRPVVAGSRTDPFQPPTKKERAGRADKAFEALFVAGGYHQSRQPDGSDDRDYFHCAPHLVLHDR